MNLTYLTILLSIFLLIKSNAIAQVGIGTSTPDPSAMLDIASIDKGILIPRMTTGQRMDITTPANGLMVFDTTINALFYCNSLAWVNATPSVQTRSNHKIIKSSADLASELTAGGGSKYLLTANTYMR